MGGKPTNVRRRESFWDRDERLADIRSRASTPREDEQAKKTGRVQSQRQVFVMAEEALPEVRE
jgi:hypothetical protein